MGIAQHTGIGRASGQVFVHKIIDHVVAEIFPNIHDEVVEAHVDRYLPGVVDAIETTATGFFFITATIGVIPGFHGDADHLVAFLVQHHGRNRAVDAAAHGDQYPSVLTHYLTN